MGDVETVTYKGEKFRVQTSGRYYQSYDRYAKYRLLHRRVWADYNGDIPENHVIHHKDHNWRNNDISNLEIMHRTEHGKMHAAEFFADPEYRRKNKIAIAKAMEKAAEWHRSEAAIPIHRAAALKGWEREQIDLVCIICQKIFKAWQSDRQYCSRICNQKGCYAKQKTQPKSCAWCNKEFLANKYRNVACCSYICSNTKRAYDQCVQSDPEKAQRILCKWNSRV